MQSLGDTFGQVFLAIRANKLRSFLTMFGIAWGVGSLLLLVGVGEGFRSGQKREFAELGNDVIMMWNGNIPAVPGQHTACVPTTSPSQMRKRCAPRLPTCATRPRSSIAAISSSRASTKPPAAR